MKGFAWIREHWGSALGFALGVVFTSITDKVIESNDLEWLKAIWRGAWGFVVGAYDWLLSSAPIPVWLALLVAALALVPVWQLAKRVRIAATAPPAISLTNAELMVLAVIQAVDEDDKDSITLQVIAEHTTFTRLQVEVALDALSRYEFIKCSYPMNSSCEYSLKSDGRKYLLSVHQQYTERATAPR